MNEDMSYARSIELIPLEADAAQGSSLSLPPLPAVKPFLRWAGGKTRLLPAILPHVPARFGTYHEPFLGSGALFFSIRERATHARLSDLNAELVNLWQVIKNRPLPLLKLLEGLSRKQGEAAYYEIRDQRPRAELQRAARFFYLNQTSWNGLWRENKFGVYNVPWGARAFRGMEKAVALAMASTLLNTTIDRMDFREALSFAKKGDFVYLDPPYLPVSDTSKFSGYNGERFRLADLEELAEETERLTKRGVHWIMSNRDNAVIRKLFDHAEVVSFTTRRSVAAQNKRHVQPKDSPEAIVIGRS